jgi:hypothetical protein
MGLAQSISLKIVRGTLTKPACQRSISKANKKRITIPLERGFHAFILYFMQTD